MTRALEKVFADQRLPIKINITEYTYQNVVLAESFAGDAIDSQIQKSLEFEVTLPGEVQDEINKILQVSPRKRMGFFAVIKVAGDSTEGKGSQ